MGFAPNFSPLWCWTTDCWWESTAYKYSLTPALKFADRDAQSLVSFRGHHLPVSSISASFWFQCRENVYSGFRLASYPQHLLPHSTHNKLILSGYLRLPIGIGVHPTTISPNPRTRNAIQPPSTRAVSQFGYPLGNIVTPSPKRYFPDSDCARFKALCFWISD